MSDEKPPPREYLPPDVRYRHDATFHAIVNSLANWIEAYQITPTEAREAAVLACTMVEMRRARR